MRELLEQDVGFEARFIAAAVAAGCRLCRRALRRGWFRTVAAIPIRPAAHAHNKLPASLEQPAHSILRGNLNIVSYRSNWWHFGCRVLRTHGPLVYRLCNAPSHSASCSSCLGKLMYFGARQDAQSIYI